jgi:3-hydroxybutyrate dehydrogenase
MKLEGKSAIDVADEAARADLIAAGFVRTPLVDKQIPEQAKELGISEAGVINALTGQSLVVSHGWFME